MPFGPDAPALGYVLEGTERVYFAGDTDMFPGMADLASDLDLAILPIGGWGPTLRGGHIDPTTAASALRLLRPGPRSPSTGEPSGLSGWGASGAIGSTTRRSVHRGSRVTAPEVTIPPLMPGDSFEVPPRSAA